jgi:hypothetical protein
MYCFDQTFLTLVIMKKALFLLCFLLTSTLSYSGNEVEKMTLAKADQAVEVIQIKRTDREDGPCCWRVCTYVNGVLSSCTDWTCGYCLEEVIIRPK